MAKPYLEQLQEKYQQYKQWWRKKKNQKLTIMLVPHNQKKPINLYISYQAITIFILITVGIMFLSAINVLNHNFKQYEIDELTYSQKDFAIESKKSRHQIKELHKRIVYFDTKIKELYKNIGGDRSKILSELKQEDRKLLESYFQEQKIPQEIQTLDSDAYDLEKSTRLIEKIIQMISKKTNLVRNTPSIWPVKGYILFPFGEYMSPISGRLIKNNGIDIGTFPGSRVFVTAPGVVYETGFTEYTGHYIKVAHKFGWKTIYSNLDRILVKEEQKVKKGDLIGFVGKTSRNRYYFLHYEVHVGTSPLNPASFLNQFQEP